MQERNWSYLAGLIDGEGCISVTKGCRYWVDKSGNKIKYPAYCLQVTVSNNSLDLMKYLIQHFGGVYYTHIRMNPNARDGFIWMPKGFKNKETLLLSILPYLVIKKEQANLALQFIRMNGEINPDKREEIHQQFSSMNRRGISPETNTLDSPETGEKIESELISDNKSAASVMATDETILD